MPAPTFYCENCKKEVSSTDKVCPNCGRFFTDVRCPRCNHSGHAETFHMGCPRCGYLNPAWITGEATSASTSEFIEILNPAIFEDTLSPGSPQMQEPQPAWIFLSVTITLGTLFAALVYVFIS
ncbi:MAG: zinc ribbon domain-containing protein [Spirochaetales bacterium]|nr:zinc ribbon domain-containing protein [Spirochaetales bacterium]